MLLAQRFVHEYVFEAVFCGEVDEVFVCLEVTARFEVNVGSVGRCAVPPLPAHETGFDARCVLESAGLSELCGECLLDDGRRCAYGHETPGVGAFAYGVGRVGRFFEDLEAAVAVGAVAHGHAGICGREAAFAVAFDEHVGIVFHVALRHEHHVAVGELEEGGQGGHAVGYGPLC